MPDRPPPEDPNAKLVDALLKKLPHAEPDPPSKPGPGPRAGGPAGTGGAETPRRAAVNREPQVGRARPERPGSVGVWTRVGLGLLLAVAITQWPYARDCGWALAGYGAAVTGVLAAAVWAGVFTWRAQMGAAHLLSLGLVLFGVGLAASVVLPRVGYARTAATWACGEPAGPDPSPSPAGTPGIAPAIPATPTDSLAAADSAITTDSAIATDSAITTDSAVVDSTVAADTAAVPLPGRNP